MVLGRRIGVGRLQPDLLPEDRRVQLLQLAARLDAELLDEHAACVLVGIERLGLPARPVQREHQLAPEPLAQRVLFDESLELPDESEMARGVEVGLDPLLQRREPELFEPGDLRLRERLVRELRERRAAPERQRLAQELRAPVRFRGLERSSRS